MEATDIIRIGISTGAPIELAKLTSSLTAVARNYASFSRAKGGQGGTLYVTEVCHGSIIIDLVAIALSTAPVVPAVIADYIPYVKAVLERIAQGRLEEVTKKEADELSDISAIVSGDNSKLDMQHINNSGIIIDSLTINYETSSAIAEAAGKVRGVEEETAQRRQLLYFTQLSKDNPKAGTRGKIDRITAKALPVVFDSETQQQIVEGEANPFAKAFHVDVVVQTVGGEPKCYKITNVHGSISLTETD